MSRANEKLYQPQIKTPATCELLSRRNELLKHGRNPTAAFNEACTAINDEHNDHFMDTSAAVSIPYALSHPDLSQTVFKLEINGTVVSLKSYMPVKVDEASVELHAAFSTSEVVTLAKKGTVRVAVGAEGSENPATATTVQFERTAESDEASLISIPLYPAIQAKMYGAEQLPLASLHLGYNPNTGAINHATLRATYAHARNHDVPEASAYYRKTQNVAVGHTSLKAFSRYVAKEFEGQQTHTSYAVVKNGELLADVNGETVVPLGEASQFVTATALLHYMRASGLSSHHLVSPRALKSIFKNDGLYQAFSSMYGDNEAPSLMQLLTHTSGAPAFPNLSPNDMFSDLGGMGGELETSFKKNSEEHELARTLSRCSLAARSGSRVEPSVLAYALLGAAVRRLAKTASYGEAVKKMLTAMRADEQNSTSFDHGAYASAIGVSMTVKTVVRLSAMVMQHKHLSMQLVPRFRLSPNDTVATGMGWFASPYAGRGTALWTHGRTTMTNIQVSIMTELKAVVVVAGSSLDAHGAVVDRTRFFASIHTAIASEMKIRQVKKSEFSLAAVHLPPHYSAARSSIATDHENVEHFRTALKTQNEFVPIVTGNSSVAASGIRFREEMDGAGAPTGVFVAEPVVQPGAEYLKKYTFRVAIDSTTKRLRLYDPVDGSFSSRVILSSLGRSGGLFGGKCTESYGINMNGVFMVSKKTRDTVTRSALQTFAKAIQVHSMDKGLQAHELVDRAWASEDEKTRHSDPEASPIAFHILQMYASETSVNNDSPVTDSQRLALRQVFSTARGKRVPSYGWMTIYKAYSASMLPAYRFYWAGATWYASANMWAPRYSPYTHAPDAHVHKEHRSRLRMVVYDEEGRRVGGKRGGKKEGEDDWVRELGM